MKHKALPPKSQAPHAFTAVDLVVGRPEIGEPMVGVNVPRSLFPRRRQRKPNLTTFAKRVETVTGQPIKSVTFAPDGAITIEVGTPERDGANGHAINPWDEVLHGHD